MRAQLQQILPAPLLVHARALDHYLFGEADLRLVRRLSIRDRLSIDVGANIGTYTYFMRRHAASVIAYEPNPSLASRLARTFTDVLVMQTALSDRVGMLNLKIPVMSGRPMHELGSIAQDFAGCDAISYEVPVSRLDDEPHLAEAAIGFIKIDAEQHETEVLRGAFGTIARTRPAILCEATPLLYDSPLPSHFSFILDLGYTGWFRMGKRQHPFSRFDPEIHANARNFGTPRFMGGNVIFLPNERTEIISRDETP